MNELPMEPMQRRPDIDQADSLPPAGLPLVKQLMAALAVLVFSGVNASTPIDVTTTTATGINGMTPNPPAITPVTAGAKIISMGAAAHGSGSTVTFTSPDLSGFLSAYSADNNECTLGVGYKDWTSGAFDPGAFSLVGAGFDDPNWSWAALTLALRPA